MLYAEWQPGKEYKFQVDSAAIRSIYGRVNDKIETSIKVREMSEFSTLFVNVNLPIQPNETAYIQLLDGGDKVVKTVRMEDGKAEFYYISPATYYLRLFVDSNNNGIWDTGNYDERKQPEAVYYYPQEIALKADWEIEQTWNVLSTPIYEQKPEKIPSRNRTRRRRYKTKMRNARKTKRNETETTTTDLTSEFGLPTGKRTVPGGKQGV